MIGRWLTIDPDGEYYSLYLAMGNNPITYIDPDGEYTVSYIIGGAFQFPIPIFPALSIGASGGVGVMLDHQGNVTIFAKDALNLGAGIGVSAGGQFNWNLNEDAESDDATSVGFGDLGVWGALGGKVDMSINVMDYKQFGHAGGVGGSITFDVLSASHILFKFHKDDLVGFLKRNGAKIPENIKSVLTKNILIKMNNELQIKMMEKTKRLKIERIKRYNPAIGRTVKTKLKRIR